MKTYAIRQTLHFQMPFCVVRLWGTVRRLTFSGYQKTREMEKNGFIKFFIMSVTMCLHGVCADGTKNQKRLLKCVQKAEIWQPIWFEKFGGLPKDAIWSRDSAGGLVSRLLMISPMMGCTYGIELQWSLLLILESIDACNQLPPDAKASEDCRSKLSASIEKCRLAIVKLMRNLHYIHSVILDGLDGDRLYQKLSELSKFYTGEISERYSGIVPGGLEFNALLKSGAESLDDYLVSTCVPHYPVFNFGQIKEAYAAGNHTDGIYLHCVAELDSYTDFIDLHLTDLRITPW